MKKLLGLLTCLLSLSVCAIDTNPIFDGRNCSNSRDSRFAACPTPELNPEVTENVSLATYKLRVRCVSPDLTVPSTPPATSPVTTK